MPAPTFGRYSVVETSSHIPREPERTATGKSVNKLRSLHYCVACRWWKRNGREPAQCVNKWLEDSAGEDKVVRAAYQKNAYFRTELAEYENLFSDKRLWHIN